MNTNIFIETFGNAIYPNGINYTVGIELIRYAHISCSWEVQAKWGEEAIFH